MSGTVEMDKFEELSSVKRNHRSRRKLDLKFVSMAECGFQVCSDRKQSTTQFHETQTLELLDQAKKTIER